MKKLLLLLLTFNFQLVTVVSFAQPINNPEIKRTWNWYFGVGAGLDFSAGAPIAITGGQSASEFSCSSISNASGNLLFYTDGTNVWNKNNQVMPNGISLNGGTNGRVLIVAQPLNDSIYYVFTTRVNPSPYTGFQYSIVNMNLQGGLGDVTVKNDTVLQDSWEKIAAVKHANGVDVWITVSEINTDKIYCYLLTASGLNTSPIINTIGHPDNYGASCSQFSPSGRKLAIAVNQQGSEIFDFNSATGILSNPVLFPASSLWGDVDAGFSPDETKLYLTRWTGAPPGKLYQVNLTAGDSLNIVNSLILIDTATDDLARIQTGADGRLYVAHYNYNYIAAINTPNALGVNCNFIQNAVYLNGGLSTNGLPSFISSYFYDSSSITTAVPINIPTNTVFAFPNPFNSFTTITLPDDAHATTDKINMILIDILGNKHELKKSITENNSRAQIKIERNNLATGIYLLNIQYNNKSFSQKLVITN